MSAQGAGLGYSVYGTLVLRNNFCCFISKTGIKLLNNFMYNRSHKHMQIHLTFCVLLLNYYGLWILENFRNYFHMDKIR